MDGQGDDVHVWEHCLDLARGFDAGLVWQADVYQDDARADASCLGQRFRHVQDLASVCGLEYDVDEDFPIGTQTGLDEIFFITLIRLTPGIPYFLQNWILAVAQLDLVRFLVLSVAIQMIYVTGFVDRDATTCAESIYFSYQSLYFSYDVRLRVSDRLNAQGTLVTKLRIFEAAPVARPAVRPAVRARRTMLVYQ